MLQYNPLALSGDPCFGSCWSSVDSRYQGAAETVELSTYCTNAPLIIVHFSPRLAGWRSPALVQGGRRGGQAAPRPLQFNGKVYGKARSAS